MDKNKKNFIILFVFIVFGLVCIFYLSVRLLLFNKGYSLSDLFFPSRNISEIINEESTENLSSDFIPGITQENLRTELTGSGFECSNPELSEKNLYRWVCWKETGTIYQEIYIFSRSLEKIDFLDMNITNPNPPLMRLAWNIFSKSLIGSTQPTINWLFRAGLNRLSRILMKSVNWKRLILEEFTTGFTASGMPDRLKLAGCLNDRKAKSIPDFEIFLF